VSTCIGVDCDVVGASKEEEEDEADDEANDDGRGGGRIDTVVSFFACSVELDEDEVVATNG
jgi:hypothetical protein